MPAADRVEIGYTWYAQRWQKTNVNTACKLLLLAHAFDSLGCAVVGLRTDNFNFKSQRAIEALGAKKDGVIRHHHPRRDGTVRDTVIYQHPCCRVARRQAASGATIGSSRRVTAMLIDFFFHLRQAKLKVSINELLTLLDALKKDVIGPSINDFYYLSRATLVKDETQFDRFDRAFGEYFHGVQTAIDFTKEIPDEWFKQMLERTFSPEEIAKLEKLGWDKLMDEFRKRLEEQDGAHHGGNKWIGSGGTSPFGHGGAHPEGIRVGGAPRVASPPSRYGRCAVIAITTIRSKSARATSRSRYDGCAASRAKAPNSSSTCTTRSSRLRKTPAGSI